MYIVFIRAALIIGNYFQFSHYKCLLTYFHYGLKKYGIVGGPRKKIGR